MSRRNLLLLAVAAIVILLVLYSMMNPRTKTEVAATGMVVVVAKRDIAPYTVLQLEDLDTLYVPEGTVSSGDAFGGPQEAVGRMITTELRKNSILLRQNALELDPLWTKGGMLIFSFNVPTAHIVGGKLRPGHHIDILAGMARGEAAESLWLARDLWVVGVYQTSGAEVARPTPAVNGYSAAPAAKAQTTGGGGLFGGGGAVTGGTDERVREGPANLVLVAADRNTSRLIGHYLDALGYNPWVFVRPEKMDDEVAGAGQIDGVVYADYDSPGQRDPDEPGIEGVTVKVYDAVGKQVGQDAKTDAKGSFAFSGLEPGVYTVEELDPAGYNSTTPNRVTVYMAEAQAHYIEFGERAPAPPKTPTPVAVTAKATEPPVEAKTPAPATPVITPTEAPTQEGACACSLYLSEAKLGTEKTGGWSKDTKEIWVMFGFDRCAGDIAYKLSLTYTDTNGKSTQTNLGSGTWKAGDSTKSIQIQLPEGRTTHPAGHYVVKMDATTTKDGKVACSTPQSVAADIPVSGTADMPTTGSPVTSFGF